jgi:hypothetical protein
MKRSSSFLFTLVVLLVVTGVFFYWHYYVPSLDAIDGKIIAPPPAQVVPRQALRFDIDQSALVHYDILFRRHSFSGDSKIPKSFDGTIPETFAAKIAGQTYTLRREKVALTDSNRPEVSGSILRKGKEAVGRFTLADKTSKEQAALKSIFLSGKIIIEGREDKIQITLSPPADTLVVKDP